MTLRRKPHPGAVLSRLWRNGSCGRRHAGWRLQDQSGSGDRYPGVWPWPSGPAFAPGSLPLYKAARAHDFLQVV